MVVVVLVVVGVAVPVALIDVVFVVVPCVLAAAGLCVLVGARCWLDGV